MTTLPTARRIVTLTLSPTLDLSVSVDAVEPSRKLRCGEDRMDPGGGGVNVARALRTMGGDPVAVVALGGHVGSLIADALKRMGIDLRRVSVRGPTRQNFAVTERTTGRQFRFVHAGAMMSAAEWRRCLEATVAEAAGAALVVASGSLPPGVPESAFADLAQRLQALAVPLIVDTSGPALLHVIRSDAMLVKPSVNELRSIAESPLDCVGDYETAARMLLRGGGCGIIAVSMGAEGALFVPRDAESFVVSGLDVSAISTIGAGDSMVAGIAVSLAAGQTLIEAARHGAAAGTAAVLAHGTGLCHHDDVVRLLPHTKVTPLL